MQSFPSESNWIRKLERIWSTRKESSPFVRPRDSIIVYILALRSRQPVALPFYVLRYSAKLCNIALMTTREKTTKILITTGQLLKTERTKKKVPAIKANGTFVVGKTLPEKLSKTTKEFFNAGVTPQKAFDIVARFKVAQERLTVVEAKITGPTEAKTTRKVKNVC